MISKVLTGVPLFDARHGGIYRGRAMLVSGRSQCGKTLFGLHFVNQGISQADCCLLLSERPAADLVIYAEALGMPLGAAVENGSLIVLEYSDYVPGHGAEAPLQLPPDGFVQLQEVIRDNSVQRVVLDTCLPWMTRTTADKLAQHVFSFLRAFDRLGVTTVLTMPKPVSPMAFKLKSMIEDIVPVAVMLSRETDDDRYGLLVSKYLGEKPSREEWLFTIENGRGLVAASPRPSGPIATPSPPTAPLVSTTAGAPAASQGSGAAPTSAAARSGANPASSGGPVRFSTLLKMKPPPGSS